MSFAAVFALVALYERGGANFLFATPERAGMMRARQSLGVHILSRMGRYFIALFVTSIIAGGETGFLALYHFHQVGTYGLMANMLAMPLFGFIIMPAGFLSLLAMPVGLEAPFMALMSFGIKSVLVVADWLTAYPGAVFYRGQSAPAVPPLALTGLSVACLANGGDMPVSALSAWRFCWPGAPTVRLFMFTASARRSCMKAAMAGCMSYAVVGGLMRLACGSAHTGMAAMMRRLKMPLAVKASVFTR